MAKFLNTSAVTYYLEEMIKNANLRGQHFFKLLLGILIL